MINFTDNTMILLTDYPVLAELAAHRTKARRLDVRACRAIYRDGLPGVDLAAIEPEEREFIAALGLGE